jgi:cytochrome c-type biogenesis protein CcmF
LKPGETAQIKNYTLQYDGLQVYPTENHQVVAARLTVLENGARVGLLAPEKNYYPGSHPDLAQWTTEVAVRTTALDDLYVILAGFDEKQGTATLKAIVNPLVVWLWIGFGVLVVGTLIAVLPDPREERALARARAKESLAQA